MCEALGLDAQGLQNSTPLNNYLDSNNPFTLHIVYSNVAFSSQNTKKAPIIIVTTKKSLHNVGFSGNTE